MVTHNLDGENRESPHFPMLVVLQYGSSIAVWRTWSSCASWHDPFDPRIWWGAWGMSSLPWAASLYAIEHLWVPLSTSSAVTYGRYHELLPTTVVSPAFMPCFHISQGWGIVWCSEVPTLLSSQTSSHPSSTKLLGTHDVKPQTLRIGTSCLHNSLGVTSQLLGCLECDWLSLQPHW
jgi:hypothetical protein